MTHQRIPPQSELLSAIDAGWASLTDALAPLSDAQLIGLTDAEGWTGRDHLVHLAAWERSMLYLLAGKPRHAGLGVVEALYLSGDFDAINAAIQSQQRDISLADALAELRRVHTELRTVLDGLTDADLQRTYATTCLTNRATTTVRLSSTGWWAIRPNTSPSICPGCWRWQKGLSERRKPMVLVSDRYTYRVQWSEEDEEYVGLCAEFPSLSWLAATPKDALSGIRSVVSAVVIDMTTGSGPLADQMNSNVNRQ